MSVTSLIINAHTIKYFLTFISSRSFLQTIRVSNRLMLPRLISMYDVMCLVCKWHVLKGNLLVYSSTSRWVIGSYKTVIRCTHRCEYDNIDETKRRSLYLPNERGVKLPEIGCTLWCVIPPSVFPSIHPSILSQLFPCFCPFYISPLSSHPLRVFLPFPLPLQLAACWADWTFCCSLSGFCPKSPA